jgi:hypothetical protein
MKKQNMCNIRISMFHCVLLQKLLVLTAPNQAMTYVPALKPAPAFTWL